MLTRSRAGFRCLQGLVTLAIVAISIHSARADSFIRGDTDINGVIEITDPTRTFRFLFLGGMELDCLDGADSDDNGSLELTDGIYTLNFLFTGGAQPPVPFEDCGFDPTKDDLDCQFSWCSGGDLIIPEPDVEPEGHIFSQDCDDPLPQEDCQEFLETVLRFEALSHDFGAFSDSVGEPGDPQPITLPIFGEDIEIVGESVEREVDEQGSEFITYSGTIPVVPSEEERPDEEDFNRVEGRVIISVSEEAMMASIHTDRAYFEIMPMPIDPAQEDDEPNLNVLMEIDLGGLDDEADPEEMQIVENDLCVGAIALIFRPQQDPNGGVFLLSRAEGSTEDANPDREGMFPSPGVWYSIVGTGNLITASTCGDRTDFDTALRVFRGQCGALEPIVQNDDDDACGLQSSVEWNSEEGVTYWILVHGFGESSGTYTLELRSPVDEPPPPFRQQGGDVNCDGVVNRDDVILLRNIINGLADACCPAAGDLDGNGVVDFDDLGRLQQLINQGFQDWPLIEDCQLPDPQPARAGDVDCDGEVNLGDVAEIQRALAGLVELCCAAAADIDGDGEIDVGDAALLNRLIREGNQEWELLEDCEFDPQPAGRFEPRRGDVNCDGEVNKEDVIFAGDIVGGIVDACCPGAADINGDGILNVLDVVGLANGVAQGREDWPLLNNCELGGGVVDPGGGVVDPGGGGVDPGGGVVVGGGAEQGGGAGPVTHVLTVLVLLPNTFATLCDDDGPYAGYKDLLRSFYESNLDGVFQAADLTDEGLIFDAEVVIRCIDYDPANNVSLDLAALTGSLSEEVTDLRNETNADVVSMMIPSGQFCGLGQYTPANLNAGTTSHVAHSVVKFGCSLAKYSFAHEIGHNLGMHHDRAALAGGVSSNCNYGYHLTAPSIGLTMPFNRTIMAYSSYCTTIRDENGVETRNGVDYCKRIGFYSRPEPRLAGSIEILQGIGCGVGVVDDPSTEGAANNRERLIQNLPTVSTYRP